MLTDNKECELDPGRVISSCQQVPFFRLVLSKVLYRLEIPYCLTTSTTSEFTLEVNMDVVKGIADLANFNVLVFFPPVSSLRWSLFISAGPLMISHLRQMAPQISGVDHDHRTVIETAVFANSMGCELADDYVLSIDAGKEVQATFTLKNQPAYP